MRCTAPKQNLFSKIHYWVSKGLFWWDTLKVANNFLGPKMPLSAFWQMLNFGETLSEVAKYFLLFLWKCLAKIKHLPKRDKRHFGAKKVLGYLQSVSPKYALRLPWTPTSYIFCQREPQSEWKRECQEKISRVNYLIMVLLIFFECLTGMLAIHRPPRG